jgi:hypothetical protein
MREKSRALLPAHSVGGAHDTERGALEIGVLRDDDGVLAAHLRDAGTRRVRLRELAVDAHAHAVRAREGDAGRERMLDERVAHDAAGPAHIVEDAGRQARVTQAVREQPTGPGRVRRTLEHDRVAGDERRGGRPARERERKVERRDDDPRAVGLHDRAVVARVAAQRIVGQAMVEALTLVVVAVMREEVGRFLRLAERLHAVLADLERERGRDVVDALLDLRRDGAEQAAAFDDRRAAPAREGRVRGAHRAVGVGGGAVGEAAEQDGAVDRGSACRAARASRPRPWPSM